MCEKRQSASESPSAIVHLRTPVQNVVFARGPATRIRCAGARPAKMFRDRNCYALSFPCSILRR